MRALYGIILTSTNMATKNSSKSQSTTDNNQAFVEQIQWTREQIVQKYREALPDLLPVIESALQSLTL